MLADAARTVAELATMGGGYGLTCRVRDGTATRGAAYLTCTLAKSAKDHGRPRGWLVTLPGVG